MNVLLLTLGEPAGIGPDCTIRAWMAAPADFEHVVIAAPAVWLVERAAMIGVELSPLEYASLAEAKQALLLQSGRLVCWNPLTEQMPAGPVTPGRTDAVTASAVVHAIRAAALASLQGEAEGIVTAPIEKAVLKNAGFAFPGHTEFLAHLARGETDGGDDFVMMLASDRLRVALLTTHMALSEVPAALSYDATLAAMRIVARDLIARFGIETPRLALCALNPHAGEDGHFGREEIDLLAPAAAAARSEGIDVTDPLPSDTLFSPAMRERFDAVVCCYHDQALIPIKALSFGESVNVTLGLPFIRTSVDHGTALDLVGSERVSSTSLQAAIRMAAGMAGHRS